MLYRVHTVDLHKLVLLLCVLGCLAVCVRPQVRSTTKKADAALLAQNALSQLWLPSGAARRVQLSWAPAGLPEVPDHAGPSSR